MNPTSSSGLSLPIVYLVDDEEVVREALAWLLRSRRLLSEGFASAEAFEAMLGNKPPAARAAWPAGPSCLLLDVRMPGMSGLALFERLAERGLLELLPVIFLTGHGDVPTAVAAVKRGAFDFVEKPFSDNALVDRIEQGLALQGAKRDTGRHLVFHARLRSTSHAVTIASTPNQMQDHIGIARPRNFSFASWHRPSA